MADVDSHGESTLYLESFRSDSRATAQALAAVKSVSSSTPLPAAFWYVAHVCLRFAIAVERD